MAIASGTGVLNISADAANTTVGLATGAGVKTLTIGSGNTTLLAKLEKLSNEDAIAYLDVWVAFATTGLDFFSRANNKSGLATGGGQ
jgi:hypothetical protein